MGKVLSLFAFSGLLFPLCMTVVWKILETNQAAYITIGRSLEKFQLMFWPSSIFMLATAGKPGLDLTILAISISVNILLYVGVGSLAWWGVHRQRWVLYVVSGLILYGWYILLKM